MPYKNILSKIQDAKNRELHELGEVAKSMFVSGASLGNVNEFQLIASQNPEWRLRFNKALNLDKENEVKPYSKEDIKAQFSIMDKSFNELSEKEKEEKVMKFTATTKSDTAGTNVAIDGVIPTNILKIEDYLYRRDAGILNDVTTINDSRETQMPEFDIDPTAQALVEAGLSDERAINKFDNDNYTLNPNKKYQVHTRINEAALRSGYPEYFALMRQKLVRSVQSLIVNQMFTGDNTGVNLHGLLVDAGAGANTRGSFDVTAEIGGGTAFNKLVSMLGQLPSDLSAVEQGEYSWVMTRKTLYDSVIPSLDDNARYYMDAIMNGVPALVGPGGLPIKLVSNQALADDRVVLAPLKRYFLQFNGNIQLLDDGGIVNFIAGQTLIKAFTFIDGKFTGNRKRNAANTADIPDRNYFRYADL